MRLASKCTCMNTPKKCMNAGTIAAMMIVWYGRFRNSTIRNAAAPMIGGVIWPPVDDAASTAAAKCARIAEADHRGDGQRADRHGVGDRRARQHAEQRRAEHADLRRPAGVAAGDRRCDVEEELAQSDARGEHAEQHEVEHVRRDHADRDAVDALARQVEMVDELRPASRPQCFSRPGKIGPASAYDHEARSRSPAAASPSRAASPRAASTTRIDAHHDVDRHRDCRRGTRGRRRCTGCRAPTPRSRARAASRRAARRRVAASAGLRGAEHATCAAERPGR